MAYTTQKLRTDVILTDRDTHDQFSDKMRFIFLQLPCFTKEEHECENDFERWIYILNNMETLHRMPFKARKSVFEKLEQIVDIASLTKEERMKYDESIKVYRDSLAVMEFKWEEGKKEGIKEGKEKGRKEERIKNVRAMKAEHIPTAIICKITGLTTEEVEAL